MATRQSLFCLICCLFAGLVGWLVACLLTLVTLHPWKDCLSFIPVVRTLRMYNSVTTAQVRYPGRGSVLSQVILVVECYALIANASDALSKLLYLCGVVDKAFQQSPSIKGMYWDNFFASFTRIMCHSILLNYLDEAYILGSSSSQAGTSEPDSFASASSAPGTRGRAASRRNGTEVEMMREDDQDLEESRLISRV